MGGILLVAARLQKLGGAGLQQALAVQSVPGRKLPDQSAPRFESAPLRRRTTTSTPSSCLPGGNVGKPWISI